MSIPLAFDRIDGANPKWTILFLHGILGRGSNLRTIAKSFIVARPHWSAFLVDLRGHGRSPKGSPDPSIAAAAGDVLAIAAEAVPTVRAIVGHSLGGKVAMEAARLGGLRSLEHLIVL